MKTFDVCVTLRVTDVRGGGKESDPEQILEAVSNAVPFLVQVTKGGRSYYQVDIGHTMVREVL
jgi:hypothetical protein